MSDISKDPFKILRNQDFDLLYSIMFYLEDVKITVRKEII